MHQVSGSTLDIYQDTFEFVNNVAYDETPALEALSACKLRHDVSRTLSIP